MSHSKNMLVRKKKNPTILRKNCSDAAEYMKSFLTNMN